MNILKSYPEAMSKREAMKLTDAASTKKMIELSGSVITPDKWIIYEDADFRTGELKKVLTIEADGELFGTISAVFIRQFEKYAEQLGEDLGSLKVVTGETKTGRDYVTCELA